MSAKYYTQFKLIDAKHRGGNEFCGVIELSNPLDSEDDKEELELLLARNFNLEVSTVKLVTWSRLH